MNIKCKLVVEGVETEILVDSNLIYQLMLKRYLELGGDREYLWKVPVVPGNVVVEVGGYTGRYTEQILSRYDARIFVLEPVKKFYNQLSAKFNNSKNVTLVNYGLGKPGLTKFGVVGAGTGAFASTTHFEEVELKSFKDFLHEQSLSSVDILMVNIEGGEYELVPQLLQPDIIQNIRRLYIQFHLTAPNAVMERDVIRKSLTTTHREVFSFPFVWECWEYKGVQ